MKPSRLILITRERFSERKTIGPAKHPFWEIIYVQKGLGRYVVQGKSAYSLREGSLVAIRPDTAHIILAKAGGMTVYCLYIRCDSAPLFTMASKSAAVSAGERVLLDVALARLLNSSLSAERNRSAPDLFQVVLTLLQMEFARRASRRTRQRTPDSMAAVCRQVIHHIEEHYSSRIGMAELAAHVHLSSDRLAHVFKRHVGTSVIRYLIEYRINVAKHMLLSMPDLPVKAVAYDTGFRSVNHFHVQFHQRVETSPAAYRNIALRDTGNTKSCPAR